MATRYLILRSTAASRGANARRSSRAFAAGDEGPSEVELSLDTVEGHETDAGALREDPSNEVVLDADIVLSLVTPQAAATADTAGFKTVGAQRLSPGLLAVGAHTTPFTGQGVTVAVLDTGIDKNHPAFAGKQLAVRNFTGEGDANDVSDRDGHGTHCAGTICGAPVGDVRIGVAPGVTKLCVGKVLGARGATAEMMLKGMLWAVMDERATIVSMSLGYDLPGNTKRLVQRGLSVTQAANAVLRQQADLIASVSKLRAFLESQSANVVFVAASGNESDRPGVVLDAGLPAAELFAVGAVGATDVGDKWKVAPFSNGRVQVVAPGVDVVSAAVGGGYRSMDGTSMATPHAAGVAALWFEKARNEGSLAIPETVRTQLKALATRRPIVDSDLSAVGAGMVQSPQS